MWVNAGLNPKASGGNELRLEEKRAVKLGEAAEKFENL